MFLQVVKNGVLFSFGVFDIWFASAENLIFIKHEFGKDVICPLKENRKVALSLEDKQNGRYQAVLTLEFEPDDRMTTIYQRRWNVEYYHKSLKQNVSLAKSPTQTETTQTNHFFAALCGYIKLEMLKVETKTNHFALKTKLYVNALHSAFQTLREMNPVQFSA